jgi:hypothetical protein
MACTRYCTSSVRKLDESSIEANDIRAQSDAAIAVDGSGVL